MANPMDGIDPAKVQQAVDMGLADHSFASRFGNPASVSPTAAQDAMLEPAANASTIQQAAAPVSLRAVDDVAEAGALMTDAAAQPAAPEPMPQARPAAASSLERAMAAEKAGITQQYGAESDKLAAQSKAIERAQADARRLQDIETVERAKEEKAQQAELEKLRAVQAEYGAMKVDPKRLWSNMSTGNKVLAGISMAFGALGAASTGGMNSAVKVIEDAISKDIDAQEKDIQTKGAAVDAQRGLLAEMRAKFGDDRAARSAARIAIMDQMKLEVDAMAAKYGSKQVQGQAQQLKAQIDQKQAAVQMQFEKEMAAKRAQMRLNGRDGAQMSQLDADIMSLPPEQQEKAMARRVSAPDLGVDGLANDPEQAKKVREVVNSTQKSVALINDLSKIDTSLPFSAKRAQADALATLLAATSRTTVVGPGAMSDTEWKLLNKVVANPAELTSFQAKEALKSFERTLKRNMYIELKNSGVGVPREIKTGPKA